MEWEATTEHDSAGTSVSGSLGYPREVVDDFLTALEAERGRLLRLVEEADERAATARTAISNHEIMLTLLVEAHARLLQREQSAHHEAAEILQSADREARALLEEARSRDPLRSPLMPRGDEAGLYDTRIIDLVSIDEAPASPDHAGAVPSFSAVNGGAPAGDGDRYFDFLRGALADDHPLGPRGD